MSLIGGLIRVGLNVVNLPLAVVDIALPKEVKMEDGRLVSKPLKDVDDFIKDIDDE